MVGERDRLLYELDQTREKEETTVRHEDAYLYQFILHGALDRVEELMWTTSQSYLKVVDEFNEWMVSAFVSPSNCRFLLLHSTKQEEAIRLFFNEVHELYIKVRENHGVST